MQLGATDTSIGAESSTTIHETGANRPQIRRSTVFVNLLHHWCFALHGLLLVLQIILFALLWDHPERNVTIVSDNSVPTMGLSAFLQAFYTLYTALLVFITQRLALAEFLVRIHKLTAIHDISGAWAGLGAAAATLWRQTKTAASTKATLLVFLYLTCVSVLHVASPTIMEFEPYNALSTVSIPSNSTWPGPTINLTTLNMNTAGQLVPLMSSLSGLSTDGILNSTLYDTFTKTSQMVSASVNADTIRASCGLLPNLSYTTEVEKGAVMITASMSDLGKVYFGVAPPLYDDIAFLNNQCTECQSYALVYLVSTAMSVDPSAGNNVSLDVIWDYAPSGGTTQNTSTIVYIVACSLEVSNYTYTLELQNGNLEPTTGQPDIPSQGWSLWTPLASEVGTQLDLMVTSAYSLTGCSTCDINQVMDGYLMSLLNVSESSASSSAPSTTLTPYELENAVSRIAAQLIWIAGQQSEEGGGFTPAASVAKVTEQVQRWRLNINTIPVIFTLVASLVLCVIVYLMLGVPSKTARALSLVEGTSVLEMLWIGAHDRSLHSRLNAISLPSSEVLRSEGMFGVCLAKGSCDQASMGSEEAPLMNSRFSRFEFEDSIQGTRTLEHKPYVQRRPFNLPFINLSQHLWCYLLHGLFVLLHAVLLLMLIRHPEHHIIIQSVSEVSTVTLATSLQVFYVLCTLLLVFITQRLAVSRAMVRIQCLTSIHDLSQAWTGIGSAFVGVWQQVKATASLRTTLTIMIYYLCASVLHITSTTVVQFEMVSGSKNNTAESLLGWPASLGNTVYNWASLSPIVPLDQLPGLSTNGLVNGTIYDTPIVGSTSVNATVNATTIHPNCGLLSNLSLDTNLSSTTVLNLTATIPDVGPVIITAVPMIWKDTVHFLGFGALEDLNSPSSACSGCDSYLAYWVTTAMNFNHSSGDVVSVSTNWTYTPPGGRETLSKTTAYVVMCSLNATTTLDVLDTQNNTLVGTNVSQSTNVPSSSWSIWSPSGTPALGTEISMAISNATFLDFLFGGYAFTLMDQYTMSLLGLNLTANNASSATESGADPTVTLTPSQFEAAISRVTAQYIWAAGHTNGHFGPEYGSGESIVTDLVVQWRLNVNTIPVVIASVASILLFVLAVDMLGISASEPSPISELGVLETLWLEAHSDVLHARMLDVEHPTLDHLRLAGMFDVCLAEDVRDVLERQDDVTDDA